MPGDGNCLFTAIAFGLVNHIQSGDNLVSEHLEALVLTYKMCTTYKGNFGKEWCKNGLTFYQGFVNIITVAHTVDWEIFAVKNISSMPLNDEYKKHELFSWSNN